MELDDEAEDGLEESFDELQLPRHLAALIGALHGPPDLGVNARPISPKGQPLAILPEV
jgi:hypothetical protein